MSKREARAAKAAAAPKEKKRPVPVSKKPGALSRSCHDVRPVRQFFKPSKTRQSFLPESDINNIFRKYQASGLAPLGHNGVPTYLDLSSMPSYQDGLNLVIRINEEFASLGSRVREKFGNDPALFLKFMDSNPSREDLEKLGLVAVKSPPSPDSPPKAGQAATAEPPSTAPDSKK